MRDELRGVEMATLRELAEESALDVVGFKRLSDNATIPTRAHDTDSGFDLYAAEDVIIEPGETVIVPTGIAVQLPEGMEAQVRPRSGVTAKTKLRVQLGTIDNGYSGEVGVIVDNNHEDSPYVIEENENDGEEFSRIFEITGDSFVAKGSHRLGSYIIAEGDRIAQMVVQSLPSVQAIEIDSLESSERGDGGFGSSGYVGQCTKNTGREFE